MCVCVWYVYARAFAYNVITLREWSYVQVSSWRKWNGFVCASSAGEMKWRGSSLPKTPRSATLHYTGTEWTDGIPLNSWWRPLSASSAARPSLIIRRMLRRLRWAVVTRRRPSMTVWRGDVRRPEQYFRCFSSLSFLFAFE